MTLYFNVCASIFPVSVTFVHDDQKLIEKKILKKDLLLHNKILSVVIHPYLQLIQLENVKKKKALVCMRHVCSYVHVQPLGPIYYINLIIKLINYTTNYVPRMFDDAVKCLLRSVLLINPDLYFCLLLAHNSYIRLQPPAIFPVY